MKLVKAYKNNEFLMSEEARSVRILCEYLEPQRRLEREGIRNAVIFYGSARLGPNPPEGPDYWTQAADLTERLARWTVANHPAGERFHIVCGGGPGIMEAIHCGAARVDKRLNVGLNISLPFEQNLNEHVEAARAFEFHYFFMRKFWFMNLAQATVAFPGGFGTMDELFEVLTLVQTGKSRGMPTVLYGTEFWSKAVDFKFLLQRGLISKEDLDNFVLVDSVDAAFDYLTRNLKPKS
jgi:uncharacterized protein (TIGR00730 family)